jgi:hypothetical protein
MRTDCERSSLTPSLGSLRSPDGRLVSLRQAQGFGSPAQLRFA